MSNTAPEAGEAQALGATEAGGNRAGTPALPAVCDVLVVGGGVNGTGIARDLAGRGLRVVLCERDDLASHTSSASTKLIHGGLRYLEHREFGLVRKALIERERLLRSAPHIMRAMRFVMPQDTAVRPAWMIRMGLFLYDHLAHRTWLPGSTAVDLRWHPAGEPLQRRLTRGFIYSDGWVDDARLVVLNAVDAAARGATILTRCACVSATRAADGWQATLQPQHGAPQRLRARALVNAAGPWASQFLREHTAVPGHQALRLVKGSHIVVRRRFTHDDGYLLQNADGRILFALPYEQDFTLLGTTDVEVSELPAVARIDAAEIDYLCTQANRWFAAPITPADVCWSYAGVRPLLEDAAGSAAAVTRDYRLDLDVRPGRGGQAPAPLLSVWGGKITTFRKLAEEAADRLAPLLGQPGAAWTADAALPGGDLSAWVGPPQRPDRDFARFLAVLGERHPQLPTALRLRWARAYGSRVQTLLSTPELGELVAPGLYEAELDYLYQHEWARSVEDVLWRRTKLGLHLDADAQARVRAWWVPRYGEAA